LLTQERQSESYNRGRTREPEFHEGDKVYLSTDNLVTDEGSKKLSDLRTGPFTIVKKVGEGAYKLLLPPTMKINPVFNVARLTSVRPDPIIGRLPLEPAPIVVGDHEEYIIEEIIDANWYGKYFQYKVAYRGYAKEHNEWLFQDDLLEDLGAESLEDFEGEFYGKHPLALRHTDDNRTRIKGKEGFKEVRRLATRLSSLLGGYCNKTNPPFLCYHLLSLFFLTKTLQHVMARPMLPGTSEEPTRRCRLDNHLHN
jgi:hypothetical protein